MSRSTIHIKINSKHLELILDASNIKPNRLSAKKNKPTKFNLFLQNILIMKYNYTYHVYNQMSTGFILRNEASKATYIELKFPFLTATFSTL